MLGYTESAEARKKMLFVLPIFFLGILGALAVSDWANRAWSEVFFRRQAEISMLAWTGAFLKVFIFLMLFEAFRFHGRRALGICAAAFLLMGLTDFAYSVAIPGTSKAAWIKTISDLFASFVFLSSLTGFKSDEKLSLFSLLKLACLSLLPAYIIIFAVFSWGDSLPSALSSNGLALSQSVKFYVWISAGLMALSSLAFFFNYLERRESFDLPLSAVIYAFALVSILARSAKTWDIVWWGWQILDFSACFIASIWLLAATMRRSLRWRLLFSLALAFGLTLLLTSGAMQSVLEKNKESEFKKTLLIQQMQNISKLDVKLLSACAAVSRSAESANSGFSELVASNSELARFTANKYLARNFRQNSSVLAELGLFRGNESIYAGDLKLNKKERIAFLRTASERMDDDASSAQCKCGGIEKIGQDKNFYTLIQSQLSGHSARTSAYAIVNVSDFLDLSFFNDKTLNANYCGRIVFDAKSGQSTYTRLPNEYLAPYSLASFSQWREKRRIESTPLFKLLQAYAVDSRESLKILSINTMGRNYLAICGKAESCGWIVADLVDVELMPYVFKGHQGKYFIGAAGMIALLIAFAVLLVLLEKQLGSPLAKILKATERLDSGDFSARINSPLENELGTLSKSFDKMADHLQSSYSDLQQSVSQKNTVIEELERINKTRTSFFTGLGHELRTPLHGILSFSRLGISRSDDKEKCASYFRIINESTSRLISIIGEMLDIAKINSGNLELNFSKSSLHLVTMQVFEELKASFEEKKLSFKCDEPDFSTEAVFDREKIVRVVRNIVGNALRFAPESSEINADFLRTADMLTLRIHDHGPGIPEKDRDGIFDEFFQSESGRKSGGTGLGLAISKKIIAAHNGIIYAQTPPDGGGGACISFSIPIEQQKATHVGKKDTPG